MSRDIDQLCINTIRTLAIDAVQKANSGHPGTPMALAPVAYTLWQRFLRFDPADPIWPNRDRFVLSAGHASMLLYSLLHLAGVKARRSRLRGARQARRLARGHRSTSASSTRARPGHPEYRWTTGVETTTGPLGQGVRHLRRHGDRRQWLAAHVTTGPASTLFDYDVYAICGDGDLMEGVSGEAASLAGHLRLANLCWIYDNNRITIEGHTDLAFADDVAARFMGYGWNVHPGRRRQRPATLIARAFEVFKGTSDRPTLIIVDSHIGYGSPHKQDTPRPTASRSARRRCELTKRAYGWPEDAQFLVPDGVHEHFADGDRRARRRAQRAPGSSCSTATRRSTPTSPPRSSRCSARELPDGWDADDPDLRGRREGHRHPRGLAARSLNAIAERLPWLVGGAADLAPRPRRG